MTANHDRVLFGGDGPGAPPRLDASHTALRFEFAAPDYVDETRDRVPVAARRPRDRVVGVDAASRSATTRTSASATTAFRVRARSVAGTDQRGGRPTRSRSCRRGTAPGGPTAATSRCWPASSSCADRVQRRRVVGKERERAQFAEAKLRAESAEALARSESEGKKNVELLSEIGREITASLDFDTIFGKLYERVNQLADADVFGVGLYHPEQQRDRVPPGDREGQALRALLARRPRTATSCRSGASSTASRCSSTTCRREYRKYITRLRRRRAGRSKTARCRSSRSRSSTCRSSPRTACSASSRSRASRSTPTPSITSTCCRAWRPTRPSRSTTPTPTGSSTSTSTRSAACSRKREQARAIAEEADAAKSAFLSTVSHELRTPLTSVLGFAKIIKKRLEDRIFPLVPTDDRKVVADDPAGRGQPEGRRQRGRAADQADRRRARPGEDRGRQARMAHGERHGRPRSSTAPPPPPRRCSSRRACGW